MNCIFVPFCACQFSFPMKNSSIALGLFLVNYGLLAFVQKVLITVIWIIVPTNEHLDYPQHKKKILLLWNLQMQPVL